jgi:photosystem II stability/assembly factor-like uncharacterized protein
MGVVAPATGWALVDQHLFWTSNDGNEWTEITPSSPAGIDGVFFLDSLRGWVVLSGENPDAEQNVLVTVASTQDAGTTWTVSPVELSSGGSPYTRRASMFFLDGLRGWLSLRLASSSNFSFGLLFRTQNGGRNWTQLPDPPAADPVYFATPKDGWIAGEPAGDQLWVTRDGGTSWAQQDLAPPTACSTCTVTYGRPGFRSALDGLLPVSILAENRLLIATYSTQDGGRSWRPTHVQEQRYDTFQGGAPVVVDSHVLRAQVNQGNITIVSDEERINASAAPAILWPMGSIVGASFSSGSSGWLIHTAGKCAAFKSQCSQQSELLSTNDGGASFRVITPHVNGAAPRASVSNSNSASGLPASPNSGTQVSQGEGFDIACVTSGPNMLTWWQYSPYYDTGVYLGGENVTCKKNTYLNPTWVNSVSGAGWGIMPLWVGLQSPCRANSSEFWTISETQAGDEGGWDADDAIAAANSLGMGGSIIYFDMEYYPPGSLLKDGTACSPLVVQFLQGWANALHAQGYAAGLYGSLGDWWTASGGAQDFIQLSGLIDDVWIANGSSSCAPPSCNDSVWNLGHLPNSYWSDNQRIHQYIVGEASETWGAVPLGGSPNHGIDRDVEDAPVFAWGGDRNLPAPTLQAPSNGATQMTTAQTFSWTAVTGATPGASGDAAGYRIMVATDPSVLPVGPSISACPGCTINYPSPSDPNLTTNSYTPAAGVLQPGMTYWWQVQARPQAPKLGDWSMQFNFTTGVLATSVQSLAVQPTTIGNGSYAVVTAALNGLAPAGGVLVSLKSTSGAFPSPPNIEITAGQTSGSVNVLTGSVSGSTNVTLTATYNGIQTATATMVPSSVVATTTGASSVTGSSATLNGTVNPMGANGWGGFEWGTDPTLSTYNQTCNIPYGYGCPGFTPSSTPQAFVGALFSLPDSARYYFRLVAYDSDNGSVQYGAVQSFTTGKPPVVTTMAAKPVTGSGATLNGTVNPIGADGWGGFEWGTDPTMSTYNQTCNLPYGYGCQGLTPNSAPQSFKVSLTGLSNSMTYYFRLVAYDSDNGGVQYGAVQSFTDGKMPVVTSMAAKPVTGSGATLNGTVNPIGADGWGGFEWGTDPTLGTYNQTCNLPYGYGCQGLTPNSNPQSFVAVLSGLPNSAEYYFRLVAYDSDNGSIQYGVVQSFTTGKPPVVTTAAANPVTGSGATLNGTVNPIGADGWGGFEWGTDPTMSTYNQTCNLPYGYGCQGLTPNSTPQSFNAVLSGLPNSARYYFRLVAYDSDNGSIQYGAVQSFTTGKPPVVTTAAANPVTGSGATLNGTVNPIGANGWGGFEWGTDPTMSTYSQTCNLPYGYGCQGLTPNSTPQSFNVSLTGLSNSTMYYFRIVAYDSDNGSIWYGNTLSFATQ